MIQLLQVTHNENTITLHSDVGQQAVDLPGTVRTVIQLDESTVAALFFQPRDAVGANECEANVRAYDAYGHMKWQIQPFQFRTGPELPVSH